MEKQIMEFQQKHAGMLSVIVAHYIQLGQRTAATITEEDIVDVRSKLTQEEKEAEQQGKIQILSADFQCYLIGAVRDLALLAEKGGEFLEGVNLLIAQNIVSITTYLAHTNYADVQKAYWSSTITHYVERWADDEEKQKFLQLLADDGMEEVIEQLINDDEVWREIDTGLEYYISHLK